MRWREISDDPNDPQVVEQRRAVIDGSQADRHLDRLDIIRKYCAGKRVLDVGCVDHFARSTPSETWLHRLVVDVAGECVGVDFEAEGVAELVADGYDVVCHDITKGSGLLNEMQPFDVVVAGELIEHLDTPRAIFDIARDVLRPGGFLIVTTPNPFSTLRMDRGQRGEVWENVDHITLIPPTGVVEMTERSGGLRLILWGTSDTGAAPLKWRVLIGRFRRRLVGRPVNGTGPIRQWLDARSGASIRSGLTIVYVLRRI